MVFNLGAHKIVHLFPSLGRAIKAGDWKQAAKESHRRQVSAARNRYVEQLFLSAANKSMTLELN